MTVATANRTGETDVLFLGSGQAMVSLVAVVSCAQPVGRQRKVSAL